MKRFSMVLATMLWMAVSSFGQAIANPNFPANANGRVMVSELSKWQFQSQTGISSGAQTVTLNGCYIKVGTAGSGVISGDAGLDPARAAISLPG
jgi:hypothetical protein